MAQEIKVECFYIMFKGDPKVGIFDNEWKLSGGFSFQDNVDFTAFKDKISEAFEYCSDTPICIETFEDRTAKIKAEMIRAEKQIPE